MNKMKLMSTLKHIFFVYNKFFNPEIELQELLQTSFSKDTRKNEKKVHNFYKNGHQAN